MTDVGALRLDLEVIARTCGELSHLPMDSRRNDPEWLLSEAAILSQAISNVDVPLAYRAVCRQVVLLLRSLAKMPQPPKNDI